MSLNSIKILEIKPEVLAPAVEWVESQMEGDELAGAIWCGSVYGATEKPIADIVASIAEKAYRVEKMGWDVWSSVIFEGACFESCGHFDSAWTGLVCLDAPPDAGRLRIGTWDLAPIKGQVLLFESSTKWRLESGGGPVILLSIHWYRRSDDNG